MNHADILGAYLQRMSKIDLERIVKAHSGACSASLNGNNSAQLNAQWWLDSEIKSALDNMLGYDLASVERTVKASL